MRKREEREKKSPDVRERRTEQQSFGMSERAVIVREFMRLCLCVCLCVDASGGTRAEEDEEWEERM